MSTNRRKRRGGAVNSRQAPKRSRLLASSAGEASAAEPIDLEESRVLSFDLAVDKIIDLTDESAEPEVIDLTGDDSAVQCEQNQQHPAGNPVVSSAADNSVVLLTSDDEEEPRDNDGTRPAATVTSPIWIDDYSQWEQNQEHPLVSSAADNSVVPLVNEDEEEPRDNDGPSATLTNVLYQDCFLGQWEQNQQHPAGNPLVSSAADNSVVLLTSDDEEEPRDNDGTWPAATVTSPVWREENSQLLEGYEQQRRNLTPRSQQLLDSPVLRSYDEYETADDVTDVESEVTDVESEVTDVESEVTDVESEVTDVESEVTDAESEVIDIEYAVADTEYAPADVAPEVRRSLDEEPAISEEWQRAVRCPICMDFFSQIIRSVRQVVSTQCGHLFCSRCIAVALENSRACPTCRTELPPRDYHPVYF